MEFRALSQRTKKKTLFWPNFLRRRQNFQKKAKRAFLGTFWKLLRSVSQKWISQNNTREDTLGQQGRIPERKGRQPRTQPPPRNFNSASHFQIFHSTIRLFGLTRTQQVSAQLSASNYRE